MQALLKGISTRSDITPANWTMYLSERLKQMWRTGGEPWPPPFAPRRGHEAMEYSVLPTVDRWVLESPIPYNVHWVHSCQ